MQKEFSEKMTAREAMMKSSENVIEVEIISGGMGALLANNSRGIRVSNKIYDVIEWFESANDQNGSKKYYSGGVPVSRNDVGFFVLCHCKDDDVIYCYSLNLDQSEIRFKDVISDDLSNNQKLFSITRDELLSTIDDQTICSSCGTNSIKPVATSFNPHEMILDKAAFMAQCTICGCNSITKQDKCNYASTILEDNQIAKYFETFM